MQKDLDRLCRKLNYQFKNLAFLKQALTHCSAGVLNNERFEFLGDSLLSTVIAYKLFEQFPGRSEGQMSRLRSYLVKGEMLATLASELNLGDYLYLGQGELKSGGFRRASILADALEAIFAAVFLDAGFEACREVILHVYKSRLNDDLLTDNIKDPKTELQEYLQSKKCPLPIYTLTGVIGEEHEQVFHVTCFIEKYKLTTKGSADTRRKAEQLAAKQILVLLKK